MSNPFFSFQQFTVWHDRCAMKVGTDGVLLGAVAPVTDAKRVLDVGSGSGLVALMLAQRNADAHITGIEIDVDAAEQARENIRQSPWPDRIDIVTADFLTFTTAERFDLIVSNPPYFRGDLYSSDGRRRQARHADSLPCEELLSRVGNLLLPAGKVTIVIPADIANQQVAHAAACNLFPIHRLTIFTKELAPPKREIITFVTGSATCICETLTIHGPAGGYTSKFIDLVSNFYSRL